MGENSGTRGTKEINKDYPITSGLAVDEKHEGRQINLVAEKGSNVPKKEKIGL